MLYLLLVYLVLLILQITLKVMSKIWLIKNLQPLYTLSYQFPVLYGPLVYLFVRQFLFQKSFQPKDAFHFLTGGTVICYFIVGDNHAKPSQ